MTAYELADLAFALGDRIDFHWGLFITVHLALLGAIVYIDRPLRRLEKVATLLLYLGFAGINYQQMNNQVTMLDMVYQDVQRLAAQASYVDSAILQRMAYDAEMGRIPLARLSLVGSHVFMLVIVSLSILFDNKIIRHESKTDSAETR